MCVLKSRTRLLIFSQCHEIRIARDIRGARLFTNPGIDVSGMRDAERERNRRGERTDFTLSHALANERRLSRVLFPHPGSVSMIDLGDFVRPALISPRKGNKKVSAAKPVETGSPDRVLKLIRFSLSLALSRSVFPRYAYMYTDQHP